MKKLTLLFFALFTSLTFTFAATGSVSGTVSNLPSSVFPPGHLVHVYFYTGNSLAPATLVLDDTTRTDSNGFYNLSFSFTTAAGWGTVVAEIVDCRSNLLVDSSLWTNAGTTSANINLNYCVTPGGCSASFTSSTSGLTANFTNTSTPISGRVTHSWNFGDGNFSNAVNPSHTYAAAGQYAVCLSIFDTLSSCSSVICDSILVTTGPPAATTISGNVATGASAAGLGVVYLITADSNNFLRAVDSVLLGNIIGTAYSFTVSSGTYYVKAALYPSNPNFSSYLPTYYTNQLSWGSATAVVVGSSSVSGININMVAGVNPGGPGFIGGLVSLGANKVAGPGDPLEGANVILTDDQGNAIAYDVTDANGEYEFPNLAYGTYEVFVDILNKTSVKRTITLSATNEKEEGANFVVGESQIGTGFERNDKITLKALYPNPASEMATLTLDNQSEGIISLLVSDVLGKEYINTPLNLGKGLQTVSLSLKDLPNGIYLVNIIAENQIQTQKLVKY